MANHIGELSDNLIQPPKNKIARYLGQLKNIKYQEKTMNINSLASNATFSYNETKTYISNKNNENGQQFEFNSVETSLTASIVNATFGETSGVKDDPLKLLFRTSVQQINDLLKKELGGNEVGNSGQVTPPNQDDFTPEKTAERIVDLSTAFFPAYREQNPDLSEEEALDKFLNVIGGGIDKGFAEAKDILKSLQVLQQGDIEKNIDSTYDLVQQGLSDFRNRILDSLKVTEDPLALSEETDKDESLA